MPQKNRLKYIRKRKKLSMKDVAEKLSVSEGTYSRYETEGEMPIEKLIILSKYYKVSIDYLLCLSDISNSADKLMDRMEKLYYEIQTPNRPYKELLNEIVTLMKRYRRGQVNKVKQNPADVESAWKTRLKIAIEKSGYPYECVADKADVSLNTLNNYLYIKYSRESVRSNLFARIVDAVGGSLDSVACGKFILNRPAMIKLSNTLVKLPRREAEYFMQFAEFLGTYKYEMKKHKSEQNEREFVHRAGITPEDTFPLRVRKLRKAKGNSQNGISAIFKNNTSAPPQKISQKTVSNIEGADWETVSMKHIVVIADFFDASLDYLTARSEISINWKKFEKLYERYCKLSEEDQELYIKYLKYVNKRRAKQ